ncbi:hypothetical protein EVAR_57276_1 [Eumeta japonica]|uniref:Uncharacterized protein n=1 Tax=Eumeta variegata TaxID=151549 RepID=A0A4C1ZXB3_EUMVA|nr:hypothetical protein EVAR_57276_1 [Eumeta japonica]
MITLDLLIIEFYLPKSSRYSGRVIPESYIDAAGENIPELKLYGPDSAVSVVYTHERPPSAVYKRTRVRQREQCPITQTFYRIRANRASDGDSNASEIKCDLL